MTTRTRRRHTSTRARRDAPRIGLALAGGGPFGGIYEVGALLALADSIRGFDPSRLDVYVGVSSGGFVAAALANGLSPSQMHRLFIARAPEAAMRPALFLQPAFRGDDTVAPFGGVMLRSMRVTVSFSHRMSAT